MSAFLIALQFLTRIPVTISIHWTDKKIAASLLWYPFVGGLISLVLISFLNIISNQAPMLATAITLGLWVLITGGLHIDGLADSADAWVGSHGDKQRALDIMKDPQAGPIAVMVIVLLLMIKFAALYSLMTQPSGVFETTNHAWLLLFPLVLSRTTPLLLFLTTPYVRSQGIGRTMASFLDKQSAWAVLSLVVALLFLMVGVMNGLILIAVILTLVGFLRSLMLKHIDGMTGDTIGATIEITEAVILCSLVFLT